MCNQDMQVASPEELTIKFQFVGSGQLRLHKLQLVYVDRFVRNPTCQGNTV